MSRPVFIEAALNGPWSKSRQPLMPVTAEALIDQGIDCAKAGASIIHIHVYDPQTGQQFEDYGSYKRVIEGIREREDVIVYPTLPLSGFSGTEQSFKPEARFEVVAALAKAGLLEWSVIDPGTTQISEINSPDAAAINFLYINSEPEIRHGLELASRYRFTPSFAIYEAGFLRLGSLLAKATKGCPKPVYRFMFSDGFSFGFPPEDTYLSAYKNLLDSTDPGALWMAAGLQVNLQPLISKCLEAGGHIRTGLEDAMFNSEVGNVNLVKQTAENITREHYEIGTASQLRRQLKTQSRTANVG